VRQRINSGDKETKVKQRAESGSSKTKQTKLNFKPVEKKPKRNPWSDVDSDEDKSDFASSPAAAAERSKPARVGSTKAKKYVEDSDEEEEELRPVAQEDSQESLPVPKKSTAVVETVDLHEEDEEAIADAVGDEFDVSSSGSDEEIVRKVAKKAAPRKLGPSQIKERSTKVGSGKPVPKKGAVAKKKFVQSSDDEKPAKKAKGRQVVDSGDDDSDFEVEKIAAKPRATGGRKKANVNYGQGDSSESDF